MPTQQPTVFPNPIIAQAGISGNVTLQAGAVSDINIAIGAAIAASKLIHSFPIEAKQNGTAVAGVYSVHCARGAGMVSTFQASVDIAATGNSTVTIDLKKNNVSLLASPLVIDNTTTARTPKVATLVATPTYGAVDYFSIIVTIFAGTGTLPSGLCAEGFVQEATA